MKITKAQLRQIIKEELEAVMEGDESLGIDDLLSEPVEFSDSGLNEDMGAISIPLAVILAGLTGVGSLLVQRHLAAQKRKAEWKELRAQVPNELVLLYETIKTDVVLRDKIEKYFEILEVVEKNKGKRSKELAIVRKAAKELSPEISKDIQRIMDKFTSQITSPIVRRMVQRDPGADPRQIRKDLFKHIKGTVARSSAITSDVNAALKAVQASTEPERKEKASMARRSKAAQRSREL
jgi:hypothetical protein